MSDSDQTEQCVECGEPPRGVTMGFEMDGWSCPYCGHYNAFDQLVAAGTDHPTGGADDE